MASAANAAAPAVSWEKQIGGSTSENARQVWQTSDNGFIIVGTAPDSSGTFGNLILVKTDWTGNVVWSQLYGSSAYGYSVRQTSDGGYIAVGADSNSLYLVKTGDTGSKKWEKTFQYNGHQTIGWSVQQTADDGYIVAGQSLVDDVDNWDVYVIKTDKDGNKLWDNIYGGTGGSDYGNSVWQTSDGGYIVAGTDYSSTDSNNPKPLLIKIDASGRQQWYKTYQGEGTWDNFRGKMAGVQQTRDGGYIYVGYHSGSTYLLKTDSGGNKQWSKDYTITGRNSDQTTDGNSVQQTWDDGYVLAGLYKDTSGANLLTVLRTDSSGSEKWQKTFSGKGIAEANSVLQIGNGSFVIAGWTRPSDSDTQNVYLIQLDKDMTPAPNAQLVSPTGMLQIDAGKAFTVTVTLTNNGTMPWTYQDGTLLIPTGGSSGDAAKFGITENHTIPVGSVIRPGQSIKVDYSMTSPAMNGTYYPEVRMFRINHGLFGAPANMSIKVVNGTPNPNEAAGTATTAATAQPTTGVTAAPTGVATSASATTMAPVATEAPATTAKKTGGLPCLSSVILPMLILGTVTVGLYRHKNKGN